MTESGIPQTQRAVVKNVLYGALTWVLPLGLSLAATPIIVKSLGIETYGIYALILGFIGYSFNFGIGRTVTKFIAGFEAVRDAEQIKQVVTVTFVLTLAIGSTGVFLVYLFADRLIIDVLQIPDAAQRQTKIGLFIASAAILASGVSQIFSSALQGRHRFDVYSKLFNLNSVILVGGNLIIAYLGFGLLQLLSWNLFSMCVSTIIFGVAARRIVPEFGFGGIISRDLLKKVVAHAVNVAGFQIVANSIILFERAWLVRHLGSEQLAYYVVAMTFGIYIQAFIGSLVLTLLPLASGLTEKKDRLLKLYLKATRLVFVVTLFLSVTVAVGSREILTLWLGADFSANASRLLVFHTVSFAFVSMIAVSWQMKEGLGVPKYNFFASLAGLLVGLPLMVILTPDHGAYGVAAGRLIGFAVMFASIAQFERWLFGSVQFAFWGRLLVIGGTAAVLSSVLQSGLYWSFSPSWPILLISVAVSGAIFFAVIWSLRLITREEKDQVRRILRIARPYEI